jgi:hypothetical protein
LRQSPSPIGANAERRNKAIAPYCPGTSSTGILSHPRLQDGPTMSLIISVLITFLVIILILYLVNLLPIDGRAKQIVRVVVIVLGILSMLKYLAVL